VRIRSIKPEFWASENMAALSRDERLVFIGLWSLADDEGRFRANPRYIAGQLLPYDEDGLVVVSRALARLREQAAVTLYEVDGSSYGLVTGWGRHQKIDRPSKSRLPDPPPSVTTGVSVDSTKAREDSSSPREASCEEQGTGNREQGEEQGAGSATARPTAAVKEPHVAVVFEAPTNPPESWGAEDFFAWAQAKRQKAGFAGERRRPRNLASWYSAALSQLGGNVEALQEAFYRFGDSKHWQAADPPLPFQAFVSQWDRYLPRGALHVGA